MIRNGAYWVPKSTFESYLKASVSHSKDQSSVSRLSLLYPLSHLHATAADQV